MQTFANIEIRVEAGVKLTSDIKCGYCTNRKCCQYVTQHIDAPRSKEDFEHLLWQVSHKNVQVYKDDEGWCLLFITPCDHLRPNGLCGIYEQRPQICRDYSNDYCEYDEPANNSYELFFTDYVSLLKYCKKRFKHWPAG